MKLSYLKNVNTIPTIAQYSELIPTANEARGYLFTSAISIQTHVKLVPN